MTGLRSSNMNCSLFTSMLSTTLTYIIAKLKWVKQPMTCPSTILMVFSQLSWPGWDLWMYFQREGILDPVFGSVSFSLIQIRPNPHIRHSRLSLLEKRYFAMFMLYAVCSFAFMSLCNCYDVRIFGKFYLDVLNVLYKYRIMCWRNWLLMSRYLKLKKRNIDICAYIISWLLVITMILYIR